MTGSVRAGGGSAPVVSTRLDARDVLGGWRVRWGIGRGRYAVSPGLYAVGSPGAESPVLVTANYKLSFDSLRRELDGLDAWILVLDTRGINVWCAAGKGTFGTEELAGRIEAVGLAGVVSHRRLILPQLGAPGVSAQEIKERSGFSVVYGPVRAADVRAYLAAGMRKNKEMRTVRFGLGGRLAVVPVELTHLLPYAAGALLLAALLAFLRSGTLDFARTLRLGLPIWGGMLAGGVLVPVLLPLLPGKPFAVKGAIVGLLAAACFALGYRPRPLGIAALLALLPSAAAYLAMNYTGSSTFTSLSGVKVEVRLATPIIAAGAAVGMVLYVIAALTGGIA